MSEPALEKIPAELGVAILERDKDVFRPVGDLPAWFSALFPEPGLLSADALRERLPFLEAILPEAEDFWAANGEERFRSGLCAETDPSGKEFHFEISALCACGKHFLLFELRRDFDETREILQRARQNLLDYELLERTQRALERSQVELRKAKDAAEAATQAKSAFLAHMSHEIRNPMNAILGLTGLLQKSETEPRKREFLDIVRNSGEALLTILNDILDFSKIESGKLELERQPFDLRSCIEEALDLFTVRATEKKLELAYEIDEGVPGSVVGDVTRLRQILVNLISNAIKFTPAGEIVVRLSGREAEGGPWELQFGVKDTGIGISPDRRDRLFQSFSQVDASVTRKYGGTGLGLAICKNLAQLMGGRMWVESEAGKGSVFLFTLRAEAGDAPPPDWQRRPDPVLSGKRLWSVGLSETNRRLIAGLARLWGMDQRHAEAPAEADHWHRSGESFDLLVFDRQGGAVDFSAMPGRRIELVPGGCFDREAAREGVEVSKPLKPAQLHAAFAAALGGATVADLRVPETVRAATSSLRILITDDSAINLRVGSAILESMGYRADTASSGVEAIEKLRSAAYDVILMDVQMPEMDGWEATRRIRAGFLPELQPRIIAMTANVSEEDRRKCTDAGMDDYVSKPVRAAELQTALQKCGPGKGALPAAAPEPAAAPAEFPEGFDPEIVRSLRAMSTPGQPDLFDELLKVYRTMLAESVARLREAISSGDGSALRQAAHKLRGSSANLGAAAVAECCARLEAAGEEGNLETAPALLGELESRARTIVDLAG